MSKSRWPSVPGVATAVLAAAASYFTLLSWDGLSDNASSYLVPLFFICAGVAALGMGVRAVHLPRPLVPLVQLLVIGLLLHRWWAPGAPVGGLLPNGESLATVAETLRRSVDAAGQYAAPIPVAETEFAPIMVVLGATVIVCVDTMACTLHRVPFVGLPLLAVFTAPVAILGGVSWATFGLAAACFLLMLAADRVEVMDSWVRSPRAVEDAALIDSRPQALQLGPQWTRASRLGVLGIGLAVVAPVLLPAGDGFLGARDWSGGSAGGGSAVRLENPLVDVKRDLVRGQDTALVEVRTADPDPSYLRLAVLDEFDGITWRPAERDLPTENRAAGEVPTAEGSGGSPGQEFEWSVRVLETFETAWLPTPFPYSAVDVDGDWRFDTDTMDLTSPGGRLDGAGVEYEVTGWELTPDQRTLASAPPAPASIRSEYTDLPSSLPTEFAELAEKVTAGAVNAFERAVMLQDWFREDGGFRYSLERAEGNGIEQLELFLGSGPGSRVGYCEQFASAMAMMARSLQIPARVAVGFLTPEKVGDLYVYSAHDLHAWPELYFEGVGWLRFEPTPARRARDAPDYTDGALPASQPVPTPSERASVAPPPQPRAQEPLKPSGESASETATPTWVSWFGWIAGALAFIALLWAPRLMRSRLQRRRLQTTGASRAEDAWSEVRATALDLRHGWDDGATLRRRARDMVPSVGAADNGDAVRALELLVLLLERSRYSLDGADTAGSAEAPRLARIVIAAMTATASPRRRRRGIWLPSSLWQGSRSLHPSAMPGHMIVDGGTAVYSEETEGISV